VTIQQTGKRTIQLLTLLLGVSQGPIFAQAGSTQHRNLDLITDRPDQTESSSVIPQGLIQLESGWLVRSKEGQRAHEWPGTLVRTGIGNRTELRLGWEGGIWDPLSSGVGDTSIGAKFFLSEESGWLPQTALLADMSIPTGSDEFSSHRADPGLRLAFSNTLNDRVSLAYNAGFVLSSERDSTDDIDTGNEFVYTAALGIGLLENLGAFIEVFGGESLALERNSGTSLDGGLTYLILPNLQLDFYSGVGLSDSADDWFLGAGFSIRLPQ
jgi:hypothetical protein